MSYQALYRVYRPQTFSELIGQDAISRTLLNALRQNRLAHAYLFSGPRGTGKTSTSKILAKAVNCLQPEDGEPCNMCENCLAINEDRFLDVIEIDAASNRGIDEIRNIREQVRFAPSMGKRKVYIIDEVHMLTTEAFNALLKTLEEPPEHVLFILATTDPQKVPKTVLSRTQRFDFHRIGEAVLTKHLAEICEQEGVEADAAALSLIAKSAAGGMRDAISLLDQTIAFAGARIDVQAVAEMTGAASDEVLKSLVEHLQKGESAALFDELMRLFAETSDARALAQSLTVYLRDLMLARVGHGEPQMVALAQSFSLRQLEKLVSRASEATREMRIAPDAELVLELALVEMMLTLHEEAPSAAQPATHLPRSAPAQKASTPSAPASTSAAKPQQKAPAAESATPAAESATVSSNADFSELKAVWPQVVESLKDISIRIHAFVKPATLEGLANGTLTLRFPRAAVFNCKQMRLADNQKILAEALSARFGGVTHFECVLEEEEQKEPTIDLIDGLHQVFGEDVPIEIIDDKHS